MPAAPYLEEIRRDRVRSSFAPAEIATASGACHARWPPTPGLAPTGTLRHAVAPICAASFRKGGALVDARGRRLVGAKDEVVDNPVASTGVVIVTDVLAVSLVNVSGLIVR